MSGGSFAILLVALVASVVLALVLFKNLQREKRHFRSIFDNATVGIARASPERRWLEVNPALCRMLGYPAEVLTHCDWIELTHPDDREINMQLLTAVLAGDREGFTLEKRLLRPDGGVIFVNLAARAVRRANGKVDYLSVIVEDITQRQLAEKQFASQVDRSMTMIELPKAAETLEENDFMQHALARAKALTSSHLGLLHLPAETGESLELAASTCSGSKCYAGLLESHPIPLTAPGLPATAARSGKPEIVNRADNLTAPLQRMLCVPVTEDGTVCMLACVGDKESDYDAHDVETLQLIANETWRIIRRQRADRALRLAMQVVNASPAVCFRWSASNGWPVIFVSENVRQWGYTPQQLQSGTPGFADIVHPEDLPRISDEILQHAAAGVTCYEQEYRLITADQQVIWVVDRTKITRDRIGLPVFFDGVLTDISERKQQQLLLADNLAHLQQLNARLEEAGNQLLQSEKMASIGQLAAGIAHELNNPIGFVHSNLGTLDGYLRDLIAIIDAYAECPEMQQHESIEQLREERDFDFIREDIFKLLAESKDGLGRVRKIVQDLKTFSRVGEHEWQEADLHQGIDSTLNIVWNELKYKCQVIKEYGDLPPVYCLISQLNQVFMNLLVNAGHAIEDKGTLTIRTGRIDSARVYVEIADSGAGIAPDNLRRIFEPFFTTKPVGQGTGLGLSVSYNIVKRHQGEISVDSAPGQGTCFRIVLPIQPDTAPPQEHSA